MRQRGCHCTDGVAEIEQEYIALDNILNNIQEEVETVESQEEQTLMLTFFLKPSRNTFTSCLTVHEM